MTIDITKPNADFQNNGSNVHSATIEFSWDKSGGEGKGLLARAVASVQSVDLDGAIGAYMGDEPVAVAYHANLAPTFLDGAVVHEGDARGRTASSAERVRIDFDRIPTEVDSLAFFLTSFKGNTFAGAKNAIVRILDTSHGDGQELVRIPLPIRGTPNAAVLATMNRQSGNRSKWTITRQRLLTTVGSGVPGQRITWEQLADLAVPLLRAA